MSKDMLLSLEKEATGLYLSGHPMDDYAEFLKNAKYERISDITMGKYPDGKRVTVAGIISAVKVRQLKNNNLLCTAIIEDVSASVNITVFANAYSSYKPLLTDSKPVIFTGRVSEREDRDIELVLEKLEVIPENLKGMLPAESKPKIKQGLYLRVESQNSPTFERIREILSKYKGDTPVYIVCKDTGKRLEAPRSLYIRKCEELKRELCEILVSDNVKFVE
jgi:DNA polymerase-3 subunit alpha